MAVSLNFTKAALTAIKPADLRVFYRDKQQPSLYLAVRPSGSKTFYAQGTLDGATIRHRVGKFPAISIQRARQLAAVAAGKAAEGEDPGAAKQKRTALKLTLAELLEVYISSRDLKPSTVADYRYAIRENYGDWLDRPVASIKGEMVVARYIQRGKVSKARTDNGFRVLRAILGFARARYRTKPTNEFPNGKRHFPENVTDQVLEEKIRFKPRRRRTVIADEDLKEWWAAVHALENKTVRNLFVFRLLTGTRVEEAATLEWSNVNLRRQTFQLRDTKTRNDVELPLPDYVAGLLIETPPKARGRYVFAAPGGGPMADPRYAIKQIREQSGVDFVPYDTRRTYISTANGLNINGYTVKALVNHALSDDVTAGYDVSSMARLKEASATIEERLLRLARAVDAKVVRFHSR
jgi:integrase